MKVCSILSLHCAHEQSTYCQYVIRSSTHGRTFYFNYFTTPGKNTVLITTYLVIITLEEKVSNLVSLSEQCCGYLFKIKDGTTARHLSKALLCGQRRECSQKAVVKVVVHIITKSKFLRNVLHCTLFASVITSHGALSLRENKWQWN